MAVGTVLVLANSAFKESPHNKSGQMLYTFHYNPLNDTGRRRCLQQRQCGSLYYSGSVKLCG